MKVRLVNCVPLSVMILLGIPKRQTIDLKNLTAGCAVTFLTGSTSGHFANLSIATYKYSKPPTTRGKGPRMSSPQTENGQDKGIVWRACAGWCICLEWNWHASHLVTCAVASWRAVGQKKPCRNALPASALAPM